MIVLPSTGALCYHNCCIGGSTNLEYFGLTSQLPILPFTNETTYSSLHPKETGFKQLVPYTIKTQLHETFAF
jgi:hypothetical protein